MAFSVAPEELIPEALWLVMIGGSPTPGLKDIHVVGGRVGGVEGACRGVERDAGGVSEMV